MTLAPRREALAFKDVDDVAEAIRERGGRLSSARRVVLAALFAADGPVSAEYIADGLGGQMMRSDVSSVYRNLERLEELGVVRHVHLGHGPGLYALEDTTEREYLVCERCNRVDAVEARKLDRVRSEVRKRFGYEVRFSHFPIVGLCEQCGKEVDGGKAGRGDGGAHQHSHGNYLHEHEHGLEKHAH